MDGFPQKLVSHCPLLPFSTHLISSWERTYPSGYKVSTIAFANGEPVAPANSNTSYTNVFASADNTACPKNCFTALGMAFVGHGRMFVSSDLSGEIYVMSKTRQAMALLMVAEVPPVAGLAILRWCDRSLSTFCREKRVCMHVRI